MLIKEKKMNFHHYHTRMKIVLTIFIQGYVDIFNLIFLIQLLLIYDSHISVVFNQERTLEL